jgi:hypothetical protein
MRRREFVTFLGVTLRRWAGRGRGTLVEQPTKFELLFNLKTAEA